MRRVYFYLSLSLAYFSLLSQRILSLMVVDILTYLTLSPFMKPILLLTFHNFRLDYTKTDGSKGGFNWALVFKWVPMNETERSKYYNWDPFE